MIIREIEVSDAENLCQLIQQVEASSAFMLWEPGERENNAEQQTKMIKSIQRSNNSTIVVAESESNELVGYLLAIGGNATRNRHAAYLVVGISERYRGQGIGANLFTELDRWATEIGIHRLELTVVTENEAGLSLYEKMGFIIEGTKRDSLFIDGVFFNEFYMSKLVNSVFG